MSRESTKLRRQLFGEQLLAHVPLAAHIRNSLEQEPSGQPSEKPFLRLLNEQLDEAEADRVFQTVIVLGTLWRGARVRLQHWKYPPAGRRRGPRRSTCVSDASASMARRTSAQIAPVRSRRVGEVKRCACGV